MMNDYQYLLDMLIGNKFTDLDKLEFYIGINAYNLTPNQKSQLKSKIQKIRLLK